MSHVYWPFEYHLLTDEVHFQPCPFLLGSFSFFMLICRGFLHFLYLNHLSDIYFGNYFCDSLTCIFTLNGVL